MRKKRNQPGKKQSKKSLFAKFFVLAVILLLTWDTYNDVINKEEEEEDTYVSFLELSKLIEKEAGKEKILITENTKGEVTVLVGEDDETTYTTQVNPRESSIKSLIDSYEVEYTYEVPKNYIAVIFNFLFYGVLIFILWIVVKPMLQSKQGSHSYKTKSVPTTTFNDIGGLSKESLNEILQVEKLLKKPEEAKKLGIRPSKGVLLHGPSGTGKTLIAKALAHSMNAEFISAEASTFVEMFAGMGAKRVRDLFQKAQKNKPAVIFIDEIDAVGKTRSSGGPNNNDEREQTLNQLLVCLDGIEDTKDIFVVAATNRLDVLDSALLRPGRFDSKILIGLPDVEGRIDIMKIHSRNKPLSDEVLGKFEEISRSLVNYSGADIESLFNNAGYNAFIENRDVITMADINYGIDRILLGNSGRSINNAELKKRIAYHEAGHAVISSLTEPGSIRKATIVPRGQALGFVSHVPKELLVDDKELRNHLMVLVAGGIAERMIFGNHSSGVSGDYEHVKRLIKDMVKKYGMGSVPLYLPFSDKDEQHEMKVLYEDIHTNAQRMLSDNREFFEAVAQLLLDKETVDGSEIEDLKKNIKNNS